MPSCAAPRCPMARQTTVAVASVRHAARCVMRTIPARPGNVAVPGAASARSAVALAIAPIKPARPRTARAASASMPIRPMAMRVRDAPIRSSVATGCAARVDRPVATARAVRLASAVGIPAALGTAVAIVAVRLGSAAVAAPASPKNPAALTTTRSTAPRASGAVSQVERVPSAAAQGIDARRISSAERFLFLPTSAAAA